MQWNREALRMRGTRQWEPQTGVEENQGPPSMRPGALALLQKPIDGGVAVKSFINPYKLTFYGPVPLSTTLPTIVLQSNNHRTYLLVQNQGPGNVWINFGSDVSAATLTANSNGLQLVTTQALEQIGGGYARINDGRSFPQSFVSSDFISAITDTAGTTMLIGEGVAAFGL